VAIGPTRSPLRRPPTGSERFAASDETRALTEVYVVGSSDWRRTCRSTIDSTAPVANMRRAPPAIAGGC
jgi:hypothetical protein